MSTQAERIRASRSNEGGFTLIEVIVALTIFSVVAVAALPLVLVALKASARAEVQTLAKDLSQLRIERMRNLAFQVDRQNGPFVDLLDRYYTNASGLVRPVPADPTDPDPGCSGQYLIATDTRPGAPTGPSYRVSCAWLPEAKGFEQYVYTQFLRKTTVPVTPPATYDSQTPNRDSSPSSLVGVTVLTKWVRKGQQGDLRTYTELADAANNQPLITTQAQAVALRVSSNFASPTVPRTLVAETGVVKVDGSLTTGSVASAQTIGASLAHVGVDNTTVEQKTASAGSTSAPTVGDPAGTAAEVSAPATGAGISSGAGYLACGWGWVGRSAYGNLTAKTSGGLPVVPASNTATVTEAGSTTTKAGLLSSGNGCAGYAFGFRNWLTSATYSLGLSPLKPLVFIDDVTGGGSVAAGPVLGEAGVTATDLTAVPSNASSFAKASVGTVRMLPTTERPGGLVTAKLTSATVVCVAGSPVTGSFSLDVTWPGGSKTVTYPSAVVPSLPDESLITFVDGGVTRRLSDFLEWSVSSGVTESASGAQAIDQVFRLTSPDSVVGPGGLAVQLGALSCNAADDR